MSDHGGGRGPLQVGRVVRPVAEAAVAARFEAAATRLATVEAALRAADGNLTRAGAALGVTKQRARALVAGCGLLGLAESLRLQSGQPRVGRPRAGPRLSRKA